ncbi:MAG: pyridoxal phosphate-dependent aminotransferase [Syntrophales bacterium]|nr:pyridoxal phosphate-dependent aminotransferase [Syntrophales bacterium]
MTISKKIQGFLGSSSWIRKMFEEGVNLKKQYGAENVFDFSLGNPSLEPPPRFKELLRDVAGKDIPGMHGYMPNAGYPETRGAVASYLSGEHGVHLSAEQIIMTSGAGGALNVILKTLLDPGDEVIIPTPFFVEYRFYVDNSDGVTKLVKTKDDFSLDPEAMGDAFTEKTKVVLINSPNNPTGKVYNEATIKELAALIEEKSREYGKEIYLVSDEPYSDIIYDGVKAPSVLSACKNSIIASSYSKSLSLAGERIGFIAVNPKIVSVEELINGMVLSNRILGFVNAPAMMQRIVGRMQGERVKVEEYKRKRDMLCDGLSSFGYRFNRPEGAFYLFVRTPVADDVEFVRALQQRKILTVPGSGFGGPGHFRIAYCVDDATITNAMEGFGQTLKEYLP